MKHKKQDVNIDTSKLLNAEALNIAMQEGKGVGQVVFNISQEKLEEYYLAALKILEHHRWEDALDAFLFLIFLNPLVANFWIGLGFIEQSMGQYSNALNAYFMAQFLDPENPTPYANSYQCHLGLKDEAQAKKCYQIALELCGESSEWSDLKKSLIKAARSNK